MCIAASNIRFLNDKSSKLAIAASNITSAIGATVLGLDKLSSLIMAVWHRPG